MSFSKHIKFGKIWCDTFALITGLLLTLLDLAKLAKTVSNCALALCLRIFCLLYDSSHCEICSVYTAQRLWIKAHASMDYISLVL